MDRNGKNWLDLNLVAVNVKEVEVSLGLLEPVIALVPLIRQATAACPTLNLPNGMNFDVIQPQGWHSDMLWITQQDEATYRIFERLFVDLGVAAHVAEHIECDRSIVLYSAMLVSRSSCTQTHFHCDWFDNGNDCFTFLTPVSDNFADIGLNYVNIRGKPKTYSYSMGKALIFGDSFSHCTAPGQADEAAVLLAFQFGTDRMERYPTILKCAYQGPFHCRPDGVFVRDGMPCGPA